jgi:hypothetical protein
MTPGVSVGGIPLSAIAESSGLHVVWRWPLGCYEASWTLLVGTQERPPAIVKGAQVDISVGGFVVWSGNLVEVDWTDGGMKAQGPWRQMGGSDDGRGAAALTAGLMTTSTPDVAVDAAIARGACTVTRPASISASPVTTLDQTEQINTVHDVLDAWSLLTGQKWYVDQWRRVLTGADPTTPTWFLHPGIPELTWDSKVQATRIIGGWHDAAGTPQVTAVGGGTDEYPVDLDNLGALDTTRASAALNSILAKTVNSGWSGGVQVAPLHIAGAPSLAVVGLSVASGVMARFPQADPRPDRPYTPYSDVVLGEADWDVDANNISLMPDGATGDGLADIIEQLGVTAA